jgi:hypothetical protein
VTDDGYHVIAQLNRYAGHHLGNMTGSTTGAGTAYMRSTPVLVEFVLPDVRIYLSFNLRFLVTPLVSSNFLHQYYRHKTKQNPTKQTNKQTKKKKKETNTNRIFYQLYL